jgi:CheY-like chemotaxis protein
VGRFKGDLWRCTLSFSVFVVDDEQVIASTMATILEMNGYRARYFTSPLEALQEAHRDDPDILISDVMMPNMNGIDLAIRVTNLYPACKVLLLSGQAATADLPSVARELGHDFSLMAKPLQPTDMLSEVGKLAVPGARRN